MFYVCMIMGCNRMTDRTGSDSCNVTTLYIPNRQGSMMALQTKHVVEALSMAQACPTVSKIKVLLYMSCA